jgi:hypothetical protein
MPVDGSTAVNVAAIHQHCLAASTRVTRSTMEVSAEMAYWALAAERWQSPV